MTNGEVGKTIVAEGRRFIDSAEQRLHAPMLHAMNTREQDRDRALLFLTPLVTAIVSDIADIKKAVGAGGWSLGPLKVSGPGAMMSLVLVLLIVLLIDRGGLIDIEGVVAAIHGAGGP